MGQCGEASNLGLGASGSVAAGLVQIGVEEERSRWRRSEERHTEKQMKRRKKRKKKNKNKRKN